MIRLLITFLICSTLFLTSCELRKFKGTTDNETDLENDTDPVYDEDAFYTDTSDKSNSIEDNDFYDEAFDNDIENTDEEEIITCSAIYFDGKESYIQINNNDLLNLSGEWTIEAWVMQDNTENQAPIIRKGTSTEFPSFYLYGQSKKTPPYGGYFFNADESKHKELSSEIEIQSGDWYHIVLEKQKDYFSLYINGQLTDKLVSPYNILNNIRHLTIGANIDNPIKELFKGLIDEVRISNGARYSKSGFIPEKKFEHDESSIVVWNFNESKGEIVKNTGAAELNGKINGPVRRVKNCANESLDCETQCIIPGETTCSDGILKTCSKDAAGCFYYSNETNCPSGTCIDGKNCGVDECLFEGITECSENIIRICEMQTTGLLAWSSPGSCNSSFCFDNYSCLGMKNECSVIGQSECSNGKKRICLSQNSLINIWSSYENCLSNKCRDNIRCTSDGWKDFSAGVAGSGCAITNNGQLFCWGENNYGQVGNGSSYHNKTPQAVKNSTASVWQKISYGLEHVCGIAEGKLFCWGRNNYSQLGDGSQTNRDRPAEIGDNTNWTHISAGAYHSCGITGGELFCWGGGASTSASTPQKIQLRDEWSEISVGNNHFCAIAQGELYCWGNNNNGEIGDGTTVYKSTPVKVGTRSDWSTVSAGVNHVCAISSGELFCWGSNSSGQLGNDSLVKSTVPLKITDKTDWESVDCGEYSTCAVSAGNLYCWGSNLYGQIGDGTFVSQKTPVKIGSSSIWTKLSSGSGYNCGLNNGELYCWGINPADYYNYTNSKYVFQKIGSMTGWENLSDTKNFFCGINKGDIYCLGVGEKRLTFDGKWTQIATNNLNICGIAEGRLLCTNQASEVFNQVSERTDWIVLTAGYNHFCAIAGDDLYCWGKNTSGQFGNGVTDNNLITQPVLIDENRSWQKLAAGTSHTCGITKGELYCWGSNNIYGVLGNGSTENSYTPVRVGTRNDWTEIYSSTFKTCGIAAGELFCWGSVLNSIKKIPVKMSVYNDWKKFSMSIDFLCGIRNNNQMFCWRRIDRFYSDNYKSYFPEIIFDAAYIDVYSGESSLCALKEDHTLNCIWSDKQLLNKHVREKSLNLTPEVILNP